MFPNLSLKLNGSHALVRTSSCFDPSAKKIGETFALCLSFVVSLGGNIVIGVIVNEKHEKTNQFFHCQHGHV